MRMPLIVLTAALSTAIAAAQQAPDRTHPPQPGPPAALKLRPTFPRDELDRERQQRLTSLLQGRDDPPTIAAVAFSRVLYGKGHRYGTPQMGTAETIKTFTSDDLRGFYTSAVRPENATLLAVGDFGAATLVPLLEKTVGSWKAAGGAASEKLTAAEPPAKR